MAVKRFLQIFISFLLALVLVVILGTFVYSIFNQEEHAIQVIPLQGSGSGK